MEYKSCELELIPIKIENTRIELWTVKRWKEAVEDEAESEKDYIKNFPLWIKIWEASIVLCEYLSQHDIATNAHALELGAGIGLAGIMLGALGVKVTLTDYDDDALALLEKNVKHNQLTNVRVQKLDWVVPDVHTRYDIVFGSELVYKEELVDPLLRLFKKCLKPDGKIVIAHDMIRRNMVSFLNRAEKSFSIKSTAKILNTDGDNHRIAIHTLRFK